MQLQLGKMTGHEIADWLGIAYSTYKRNPTKQLQKLNDFCQYKQVRGGIEIEEIYQSTYNKEFIMQSHLKILSYILDKPGYITTMRQIAKDLELSLYTVRKAIYLCFGQKENVGGIMGHKERLWTILLEDNSYRPLTKEELSRMNELAKQHYIWANEIKDVLAAIDEDEDPRLLDRRKKELRERYYDDVLFPLGVELDGKVVLATAFVFSGRIVLDDSKVYSDALHDQLIEAGYKLPDFYME